MSITRFLNFELKNFCSRFKSIEKRESERDTKFKRSLSYLEVGQDLGTRILGHFFVDLDHNSGVTSVGLNPYPTRLDPQRGQGEK